MICRNVGSDSGAWKRVTEEIFRSVRGSICVVRRIPPLFLAKRERGVFKKELVRVAGCDDPDFESWGCETREIIYTR